VSGGEQVCVSDDGAPAWGTKPFPKQDRAGRFVTLASGFETDDDALPIRTEARVLGATLNRGQSLTYDTEASRFLYLVPSAGSVKVNGVPSRRPRRRRHQAT
jgi:hypothetical protein